MLTRSDIQKALINCTHGGDCRLCPGDIRRWKPCRDRLHILAAYALNKATDEQVFPPQAVGNDQGIGYFYEETLNALDLPNDGYKVKKT